MPHWKLESICLSQVCWSSSWPQKPHPRANSGSWLTSSEGGRTVHQPETRSCCKKGCKKGWPKTFYRVVMAVRTHSNPLLLQVGPRKILPCKNVVIYIILHCLRNDFVGCHKFLVSKLSLSRNVSECRHYQLSGNVIMCSSKSCYQIRIQPKSFRIQTRNLVLQWIQTYHNCVKMSCVGNLQRIF